MFENDFIVEFSDEELGECRTYLKNFKGYEQAIKDLKLYKGKQNRRIAELEEQIAEKEKEIESLKVSSDKNIDYLIEFASLIDNEKDCNRMLKALNRVKKSKKYIVDKDNQDKISFAVEKLQEAKRLLKEKYTYDVPECDFAIIYEDDIDEIIDNQINKLKGEINENLCR